MITTMASTTVFFCMHALARANVVGPELPMFRSFPHAGKGVVKFQPHWRRSSSIMDHGFLARKAILREFVSPRRAGNGMDFGGIFQPFFPSPKKSTPNPHHPNPQSHVNFGNSQASHRGSFPKPSPIASELTMLHAMLCKQKKNPKAERPKLCYHAKLHGKLPLFLWAKLRLEPRMAQARYKSSWGKLPLAEPLFPMVPLGARPVLSRCCGCQYFCADRPRLVS